MWIVPVAIVAGVVLVLLYNTLVGKKNQVTNVFGTIDALLKKRYDLLPKLITTVKVYMKHEKEVLEKITEMRAKAVSGRLSDDEQVELDNVMTKMLGGIMVAVENYPDLKANQNFLAVQEELTSTENKISFARQNYNDQVLFFNNKIQMFPSNMVANAFNFGKRDFFELESEAEREVPKVSFGN